MYDQILSGLHQMGWQISSQGAFHYALREQQSEGLIFAQLSDNVDPAHHLGAEIFPSIKSWNVIVFCPSGVNSNDLKNLPMQPNVQYWFWDIGTGHVFPSPPTQDRQIIQWLALLSRGQVIPLENFRNQNERVRSSKSYVPYATYLFLGVNILVFLLMTLAGGSENQKVLILFGAKVNELIRAGEYYRLLTSVFIHIGILHLLFNSYALYSLGTFAERFYGHWRYAWIYLLSGVAGSFASFVFSPALSAGASGAIFGLMGALLVYSRHYPRLWNTGFGTNLLTIVGVNLMFGFLAPGIDNYAHLGGLFAGAAVSFMLLKSGKML